ncbi:MAG TPA: nitrilase-related carbon-nitrogen hydrolase [Cyclobacteriaceae bacterium]|nr:nitrilase-related carbon-nitrogen hydrolase [Cyclobacteriaceae bacterium]
MPDRQKILKIVVFFLCALLSGVLYFFSTGVEGIRPMVWIAPVPVLVYSINGSRPFTIVCAFIAYFIGNLNLVPYLVKVTPLLVIIIYFILVSSVFALTIAGFRYASRKYNNIIPAIFFASAWTSWEFLLSLVSPHGTAFSIAYTQSDFLPFLQLASVTGLWGLIFFLLFVPASAVMVWHCRDNVFESLKIAFIPMVLFFIIFYFGFIRLHQYAHERTIHTGLAASDTSTRYFATKEKDKAIAVIRAYQKRIDLLAYEGAEIIVLPEKLIGVTSEYTKEITGLLKQSAKKNRVYLVAGLNVSREEGDRNLALVVSPQGTILCDYDKRYFIPGAERGYIRGSTPGLFELNDIKSGIQICKDMDFPRWSNKYSRAGARIMFVPAWDFTVDAWLHSRMAVMRAVENGFSLVRCAQQGYLSIIDFRGKVIAETSTTGKPDALLEGYIFPGPGHTFYSRTGNWFAWMNLAFIIIILAYPKVYIVLFKRRATG